MQLLSKCFQVQSSNDGFGIFSPDGKIIASARPKGGLFCFNTLSSSSVPAKVMLSKNCQRDATEFLHHRFAHVGPQLLGSISVPSLKLPTLKGKDENKFRIDNPTLHSCDVCNSCKQVERINRGPVSRSSNVLELVHSDTWGKCQAIGIFGSSYFVTFIDDHSRESMIFLMKNKYEVPSHFQEYKAVKELQSGHKIKSMRFDGGSEYKKINFSGIRRQISAPYTQHQNGVAERSNRSIITMARCMLSHAHLPIRFWDAAVLTASYLRNRLPILPEKLTPFEAMNGNTLITSHLKVWGCVCYALIDDKDPRRQKLKNTSLKGIFVGYCESITQYKVYIPSKSGKNKIITSANVKFLEDSFWEWGESHDVNSSLHGLQSPIIQEDESDSDSERELEIKNSVLEPLMTSASPITAGNENTLAESEDFADNIEEVDSHAIPGSFDNPQDITSETLVPRRSNRILRLIEQKSSWQPSSRALYVKQNIPIPQSYKEAINGPDKTKWLTAIGGELESLDLKKVFNSITHIPHGRKPVGLRWVFPVKSDGRYKARLVAQGFSQTYGVDYFDTYSPTLRMDSLRILLAVANFCDWEIHQIDVKTAYLEGDLHEEIYMRCPEGMTGTKYVRVDKALYGLKQSGRVWYQKLNNKLYSLDFKRSNCDQCIYIHSKVQVVIGVYVDDLIICGKVLQQVVEIKQQLSSFFPIKDLGLIGTVIGWNITRDRSNRILNISQRDYLVDKVASFGLQDAKACATPMDGYSGIVPGGEEESLADESAYASAVGSLGYASNGTRPNICFATSQLGSFNSRPVDRHWNSVCRVLRYTKGSTEYCVTYNFGPVSQTPSQELKATLYSDSDYASDTTTRRSVSGYILMLGGGPVCWQAKRQKSVST
ncbi:Bgt-51627 [Blumeria graminis f. sp. tritici]|uniref:Bgt-51627 n=1 Tax=Blumeria graminis f. sp. tritici TaxID=62690 RepID=A0A9X9QEA1_BLUGR|nr:Bgt-51627 [Blumeria graminis f. sp. tritici]